MGVKNLPKLIEDRAGTAAVRSYKFSKFRRMTVAIDASLLIHQTVIAMRSSGRDMKNKRGELTGHLHGLFYKILIFLQNEMVPIFVFDGKAPDIKNRTMEKRRARKNLAESRLSELSDSEGEEYIKNFKQTFRPTKENIREAQILLDLMGIPYIVAPGEADVVCAWLAARNDSDGKSYVKGVCSDDSDMLALGAPYLFKDMLRFMAKNKPVKVISLNKALVRMNLTMDQFVDLCVLLGTDYCDQIKGIGPVGAYKQITKYGSLQKVLKSLHSDTSSEESSNSESGEKTNEQCMIDAQYYFKNALREIDESDTFVLTDDNLKLRNFQYEELMDFMCVKHDFDVTRIQTGVDRLKKYYKVLNVTRENTKAVHTILQPRSENYIFKQLSDDIDFISSDDDSVEKMPSKKNPIKESFTKKPAKTKPSNPRNNIKFNNKLQLNLRRSVSTSKSNSDSDITLSDLSDSDSHVHVINN